jgi:hypothetical protein
MHDPPERSFQFGKGLHERLPQFLQQSEKHRHAMLTKVGPTCEFGRMLLRLQFSLKLPSPRISFGQPFVQCLAGFLQLANLLVELVDFLLE